MKTIATVLLLGFVVATLTLVTVESQEATWKQKVLLLQSTRADVEKLFGKPIGKYYDVTYNLGQGTLYIEYYDFDRCKPSHGYDGEWNLPEWTVTEIRYRPDHPPTFASLHLDLSKLRKLHLNPGVPDVVSYVNDEEGVEYTVESDGRLNNVRYFPGSRYERFRCPKK